MAAAGIRAGLDTVVPPGHHLSAETYARAVVGGRASV